MHTTTVRFNADVWAAIKIECDRLGIATAEYIRTAVLLHMGDGFLADRVRQLEVRQGATESHLRLLALGVG